MGFQRRFQALRTRRVHRGPHHTLDAFVRRDDFDARHKPAAHLALPNRRRVQRIDRKRPSVAIGDVAIQRRQLRSEFLLRVYIYIYVCACKA